MMPAVDQELRTILELRGFQDCLRSLAAGYFGEGGKNEICLLDSGFVALRVRGGRKALCSGRFRKPGRSDGAIHRGMRRICG